MAKYKVRNAGNYLPADKLSQFAGKFGAQGMSLRISGSVVFGVLQGGDGGDLGRQADSPRRRDAAQPGQNFLRSAEVGRAHATERIDLGHGLADDDVLAPSGEL